ncbi:MAG: hypothetical protein HeimC2_19640 [Candidatus Heimdallarchaeota archaeon LC_2]|nr:MAG: hypothetical protein HeimC2_19640 [Candidatus Heimdallarchaeota archaeon LC_2]
MSSRSERIKMVGYICGTCKKQRKLTLNADVHLKRRELSINGLASYIDIHTDSEGKRHGAKLFIDPNFHVRTNSALKLKKPPASSSGGPSIPLPGLKTKNLTTRFNWDSWDSLELNLKGENIKFLLEIEDSGTEENRSITIISTKSELESVTCEVRPTLEDQSPELLEYMEGWLKKLCDVIELASSLHVEIVPEILRYIDHHVYRRITYNDGIVMSILVDRAAILIPDKKTLKMVANYGPAMKLVGLDPAKLARIAETFCEQDQFSMVDIQKILDSEMAKGAELEEEVIVLSLFYLLSLDAFGYRLSYLSESEY